MNELFIFNTPIIHIRFASNFAIEKISHLLQDRGMNAEVAIQRAYDVFHNREKANLYLSNFNAYFDKDIMHKVYDYIANKALFQEKLLFGSYDQMLRLTQQISSGSLNEKELLQIKHIAQANRYGIALTR